MSFEPPFPPPLPPEGPPPLPPAPEPGGTPWERRDQIGFVTGLVETTQQVLLRPSEFFARMPVSGGVGSPLLYAVILGYAGLVATTLYGLVFSSVLGDAFLRFGSRSRELERFQALFEGWVSAVVQLVTGPVWIVIGAFVGAGILHVLLLALGGASRDFEATFRVVCYGHALNVLGLLPFCGNFIAIVWWIAVTTIGLATVHRTSTGIALAAVLLPIIVCCCCCGSLLGIGLGGLASVLGQMK